MQINDRIKESCTATGTGVITLDGAADATFLAYASRYADGDSVPYCIVEDAAAFEIGLGTYASGSGTITRTAGGVLASSNADGLVSFGVGSKTVFVPLPAAMIAFNPTLVDPANPVIGQSWLNTVDKKFRGKVSTPFGAWVAGGNTTGDWSDSEGCGTQGAGLVFGQLSVCEEYNGTSWSSGGSNANTRTALGGLGTQTAALRVAGYSGGVTTYCAEYDGATWVATASYVTGAYGLVACGTQVAGLAYGGYNGSAKITTTQEYNGASWSSGGGLLTKRDALGGCGTQISGLAFGGYDAAILSSTEEYNGTLWSSGGVMLLATANTGAAGSASNAVAFGGAGSITSVYQYDGTTWAAGISMTTGASDPGQAGNANAALAIGGQGAAYLTQEYNYESGLVEFQALAI